MKLLALFFSHPNGAAFVFQKSISVSTVYDDTVFLLGELF